ncbi:hypothetical protein MBLNU457_1843t1 [Dothideomycetes sp. NU457]
MLRLEQRRWARVLDVRLFTRQKSHSIEARYQEALARKAKEEGHGSIDELKSAYSEKISTLRQRAAVPGATAPLKEGTANIPFQPPPPPEPQQGQSQSSAPARKPSSEAKAGIKTLESFVDVEKMMALPQKEIEYLWRLRHASNPNSLCATVNTDVFKQIAKTAKKHPQFILPLPREGQGAEIHFLQWTFPSETTATVLFTNLAEFKLRGAFAQPHTTVTHHLDLSESKGVVLLEGSVLPDRGVSVDEGKFLLMTLQKFYGQTAEQTPRRKLMEQFSQGDEAFKIEELLEEAEKIP